MPNNRPVPDTGNRSDYNISENTDYLTSASSNDCTGLIPAGITGKAMLDAYHELYPFGTPEVSEKEK